MSRELLYEKMMEVIKTTIFEKNIQLTDRLVLDLGIDSLDLVEMIINFETEFKIHIKDEEVDVYNNNTTVQEVFDLVEKTIKEQKPELLEDDTI